MSYAVINTKIDPKLKKEAQNTAEELGIPLSVIIKGFLKQFVRNKTITFSLRDEEPSAYLLQSIKNAEEQLKKGDTSPTFADPKEAVRWLHKQRA